MSDLQQDDKEKKQVQSERWKLTGAPQKFLDRPLIFLVVWIALIIADLPFRGIL